MQQNPLFDGLPNSSDIVKTIKKSTFVIGDNYTAETVEHLFREDPEKAHSLKKDTATFKNWKESLRIQKGTSEIIRNHQNSEVLNSELSSQPTTINNNIVYNNNLRIQENGNNEVSDIYVCVTEGRVDEETHAKLRAEFSPKNMNSVDSEALASVHALEFSDPVLNSEASASDQALNSETRKMNSEASASNHALNSATVSLLKKALIKFAWDEYKGVVPNIDEFIRMFNNKIPAYKKAFGKDVVGFNANKLHMRGWK